MKTTLRKFQFLAIGLFISAAAFAQSATITGKVVDETGALPGASVKIQGTFYAVATDASGAFRLSEVQTGEHVLEISFIGYATKTIEVAVKVGNNDLGNLIMNEGGDVLNEVVVQGTYLPSQMKALSLQKHSAAIMNVLASDAIGKLPDRNAAEAVQRIQGVSIERDHGEGRYVIVRGTPSKWNSNLINGNRLPAAEGTSNNTGGDRAVPLDIFPTEMIQFVQLSKALTPDIEGDAIGGSVNFVTRTAPEKRTLNVSLAGGYNDQAAAGSQNFSILYGDRFLKNKLGLMLSATNWSRNWGTDNYEIGYNENLAGKEGFSLNTLELRDYLGKRTTNGLNFGAEYNLNANSQIFARGTWSRFEDLETAREHIYNFDSQFARQRVRKGITRINLMGGEFGGKHSVNNAVTMDWKVSSYQNQIANNYNPVGDTNLTYLFAIFQQFGVQFDGLAADGRKYLSIDDATGDAPGAVMPHVSASTPISPSSMLLYQMYDYAQYAKEKDYVGEFNVEGKVNDRLVIKGGAKMRAKNREAGAPLRVFMPGGLLGIPGFPAPTVLAQLETEAFPFNGGYLSETGQDYSGVVQSNISTETLINLFTDSELASRGMIDVVGGDESNPSYAGNYYVGNENSLAAYVMGTFDVNEKVKLIGGFRHEMTMSQYTGNEVLEDTSGTSIQKITGERTTHAFLPMVHVKYTPNEKTNVRFAATRSYARPDFGALNPATTRDDVNFFISSGNTELNPTFSNNLDIMVEHFLDNVGIVSGGVFFKQITNDIYTSVSKENIDGMLYTVTKPLNLEAGWLAGFEIGGTKRLDMLPNLWSGLGVEANYTFTESSVNVPTFTEDASGNIVKTVTAQSFPSQAKHVFNSSVFYEKNGLLLRVAANYKGSYVELFSAYGPEHNRYYGQNLTVDFSAAYKINDRMRVFAEINNLTNAPLYYYHGDVNRPEQVEYYSIRGQAGIRFNLF